MICLLSWQPCFDASGLRDAVGEGGRNSWLTISGYQFIGALCRSFSCSRNSLHATVDDACLETAGAGDDRAAGGSVPVSVFPDLVVAGVARQHGGLFGGRGCAQGERLQDGW